MLFSFCGKRGGGGGGGRGDQPTEKREIRDLCVAEETQTGRNFVALSVYTRSGLSFLRPRLGNLTLSSDECFSQPRLFSGCQYKNEQRPLSRFSTKEGRRRGRESEKQRDLSLLLSSSSLKLLSCVGWTESTAALSMLALPQSTTINHKQRQINNNNAQKNPLLIFKVYTNTHLTKKERDINTPGQCPPCCFWLGTIGRISLCVSIGARASGTVVATMYEYSVISSPQNKRRAPSSV